VACGDGEGSPARRRSSLLRRAASGFTLLFTLFSLTPATPRNGAEREGAAEGPDASGAALNKLVLGLTFLFVLLSLAASSSLVVFTAWTHDLRNGAFALAFAVVSARVAMNWLVWKDEE